jgi:hypothetical protein
MSSPGNKIQNKFKISQITNYSFCEDFLASRIPETLFLNQLNIFTGFMVLILKKKI